MRSSDPLAVVNDLDPDLIQAQLVDLDAQRKALCVLLRAARARHRARRKAAAPADCERKEGEPCHA